MSFDEFEYDMPPEDKALEATLSNMVPKLDRLSSERICFEAGRVAERAQQRAFERTRLLSWNRLASHGMSLAAGVALTWLLGAAVYVMLKSADPNQINRVSQTANSSKTQSNAETGVTDEMSSSSSDEVELWISPPSLATVPRREEVAASPDKALSTAWKRTLGQRSITRESGIFIESQLGRPDSGPAMPTRPVGLFKQKQQLLDEVRRGDFT